MSGIELRRKYNKVFKGLERNGRMGAGFALASYILQIIVAGVAAAALLEQGGAAAYTGVAFALLFIGTRMRGLNNIIHECSHYSFTEKKNDNILFGSIAASVLMSSYSAYRAEHMTHHAHLGDYEKDQDIRSLKPFRLESALDVKTVARHVLTPVFGMHLPNYIRLDLTRRDGIAFFAIKVAMILAALSWAVIDPITAAVVVLVPVLWIYPGLNYWADCIDHAGILDREDALESSRNWIVPRSIRWLLFPRNDCFHLIHHLFPNVPSEHFEDCHALLMQDPAYRRVNAKAPAFDAEPSGILVQDWR